MEETSSDPDSSSSHSNESFNDPIDESKGSLQKSTQEISKDEEENLSHSPRRHANGVQVNGTPIFALGLADEVRNHHGKSHRKVVKSKRQSFRDRHIVVPCLDVPAYPNVLSHQDILKMQGPIKFEEVDSIIAEITYPVVILHSPDGDSLEGLVFGYNNYRPRKEKFKMPALFTSFSEEKLADVARNIHACLNRCGVDSSKKVILIQDKKCFDSVNICMAYDKYSQTYFVDHYALQHVLSMKLLKTLMTNPQAYVDISLDTNSPNKVVLMFNSKVPQEETSLPESTCCKEMASMCSKKFQTQPIIGRSVTKHVFHSRVGSAEVIIFHIPVENSTGSLVFNSSTLTPEEVSILKMKAALVILPPFVNREHLSKMTAAFLAAGAQSVLTCPLNIIVHESHSTFMEFFIGFLLNGFSSVCALRRAQNSLRCISEFSDSTFWSEYRIIGRDVQVRVAPQTNTALDQHVGPSSIATDQDCLDLIQEHIADAADTTSIQVIAIPSNVASTEAGWGIIQACFQYVSGTLWVDHSSVGAISSVLDKCIERQNILIIFSLDDDDGFRMPPMSHDLLKKTTTHIVVLYRQYSDRHWEFIRQLSSDTGKSWMLYQYRFSHTEALKSFIFSLQQRCDVSLLSADVRNLRFLSSLSSTSTTLFQIMVTMVTRELEEASLCSGDFGCQQGAMRRTLSVNSMWLSGVTNLGEDNSVAVGKMLFQHIPLTLEETCLLECLSLFKNTPVPGLVVELVAGIIATSSSKSISYGQLIETLKTKGLLLCYPPVLIDASKISLSQELFTVVPIVVRSIEVNKFVAVMTALKALHETCNMSLDEQSVMLRLQLTNVIKEEIKNLHDSATDPAEATFLKNLLDSM